MTKYPREGGLLHKLKITSQVWTLEVKHGPSFPWFLQRAFAYVQFSSEAQLCPTLCDPMDCCMPGFPVHHHLPELAQTHVHRVGNAIQPSHPLSHPSPSAFDLSQHQGLFQWSPLCIRWPKDWSFSFSISPSNEHPGLISFRMDWLDLLAVQGTLKPLILWLSFLYSPNLTSERVIS